MERHEPSSCDQRRLYADLAWTWPIISAPDHYIDEAQGFIDTILRFSHIGVRTLLDLGCGGGHVDRTLKKHVEVTGVDTSEAMLSLARRLNPDVTYCLGDMRTVRLGRTFDAVIAADSIDYMLDEEDLYAAFVTAFEHLEPGGVFCTYAEVTRENWQQNAVASSVGTQGRTEIAFIENRYDPDPTDSTYESTFLYLIRQGGQLTIETDRHLSGIFALDTWRRLLHRAGFAIDETVLPGERIPMFACLRPSAELKPRD